MLTMRNCRVGSHMAAIVRLQQQSVRETVALAWPALGIVLFQYGFICISLTWLRISSILLCAYLPSIALCSNLLPIFQLGCFFLSTLENSFYMMDASFSSCVCFAKNFSQSMACVFIFLNSFRRAEVFNSDEIRYISVFLFGLWFWCPK